jgi:hypothetical protein
MISKFDLAKALLTKAQAIADANDYLLIKDGESYKEDVNTAYIQEFCLYGDDNTIGLSASSHDIQFGIYQLNVNTPKSFAGAKWLGLNVAGGIQ